MLKNKKVLIIIGGLILAGMGILFLTKKQSQQEISSFEDCALVGYPMMESYPRQCRTPENKIFVEDIGNELEKLNLIRLEQPRPNQTVQSPVLVQGEARGYWFFEASFPILMTDSNGDILGSGVAWALSDWMAEDFVPFKAEISFDKPETKTGYLILKKDNPSGLPENDDFLKVPVKFE